MSVTFINANGFQTSPVESGYETPVSLPSGALPGDIVLAFIYCTRYTASDTTMSLSVPSGWTEVNHYYDGDFQLFAVYSHIVVSGDSSYNFAATVSNSCRWCVELLAYRGANIAVDASDVVEGSTAASVTTTMPNDQVVYGFGCNYAGAGLTLPVALTERVVSEDGYGVIAIGDLVQTTAGATPTETTSLASSSATIALLTSFTAPGAPTLVTPANAGYTDVSSGVEMTANYNSTDGTTQNAYAMRIKVSGGSYVYWNAGTNALQSSIVWNSDSVAVGGSWSVSLPSGALSDGNVYNWSMACEESGDNLQGPFATDFTFTSQTAPTVSVTAPTGSVGGTTEPGVTWVPTVAGGASQVTYQVIVEYGSYGTTPGSGTQAWTSGVVTSSATAATVGTALTPGTTYRVFVQITETGGQSSNWGYSTFTLTVDVPATPIVIATPTTDPDTGCPMIQVTVQGQDNALSAVDSSFETGVGTAVGTNCSVAQSDAESLDAAYSLLMTSTASGSMSVKLGPYTTAAGQEVNAFAAFRAVSTARTCTVGLTWEGASGTPTSSGYADSSSAWSQTSETSDPPAGLVVTATAPSGATGYYVVLTVESAASDEGHYVDCVAVKPDVSGVTPTWSLGGFVGLTSAVITRSDNIYVRNASAANPLTIPSGTQLATVDDYEVVPLAEYTYAAVVNISTPALSSASGVSGEASVTTTKWWELNPLIPSTAVAAQMVGWTPVNTEQSSANQVLNQTSMNVVAAAMMNQDFSATAETFDNPTYGGFDALLTGQQTVFISSPWGATDSGYFRLGPTSGGMSSGVGNTAKSTTLMPSTASAAHRSVAITAVSQPRPTP